MSERLVFSVADLAEAAGVCDRSVLNWIRAGLIPARKLGRRTVILRADAIAWLENSPRVPTTGKAEERN
jgi:hypothetical protein